MLMHILPDLSQGLGANCYRSSTRTLGEIPGRGPLVFHWKLCAARSVPFSSNPVSGQRDGWSLLYLMPGFAPTGLLIPDCGHGIDLGRAPGGDPRRGERGGKQHGNSAGQRRRVVGPNAEQRSREDVPQPDTA